MNISNSINSKFIIFSSNIDVKYVASTCVPQPTSAIRKKNIKFRNAQVNFGSHTKIYFLLSISATLLYNSNLSFPASALLLSPTDHVALPTGAFPFDRCSCLFPNITAILF